MKKAFRLSECMGDSLCFIQRNPTIKKINKKGVEELNQRIEFTCYACISASV